MQQRFTLTAAALMLAACTGASASTLFLPQPQGQTIVAGWVPTNASIVDGKLEFDGAWGAYTAANTNIAASYTSGQGDFNFVGSTRPTLSLLPNSIYTGNSSNSNYNVGTSNYTGAAFSQITLQFAMNSSNGNDTLANLNPFLNIGSETYGLGDISFFSSNHDFQPEGFNSDPTNRYNGHFGLLTLVTITWDLDELNFIGDLSEFNIDWTLSSAHSALYDVQISVNAVPEPTTVAALLGAAALLCVALRCRTTARRS